MSLLVTVAKERNFRHFTKWLQEKTGRGKRSWIPQILHDEAYLKRCEALRVLVVARGLQLGPERGATP